MVWWVHIVRSLTQITSSSIMPHHHLILTAVIGAFTQWERGGGPHFSSNSQLNVAFQWSFSCHGTTEVFHGSHIGKSLKADPVDLQKLIIQEKSPILHRPMLWNSWINNLIKIFVLSKKIIALTLHYRQQQYCQHIVRQNHTLKRMHF